MKQTVFAAALIAFVSVTIWGNAVSAHEGRIVLKNSSVACEGISIWKDTRYRIFGRCSGLVYPFAEKIGNYLLWVVPDGETLPVRVANIADGFFDGQTEKQFSQIFITAEGNGFPRQPGELVIASANINPFDFNPSQAQTTQPLSAILQPSPSPQVKVTQVGENLKKLFVTVAIIGAILGMGIVVIVILSRRG